MIAPNLEPGDSPESIELNYRRAMEALSALADRVLAGGEPPSTFHGLTPAEVDEALTTLERELRFQAALSLAAAFEAVIRVDCYHRIHRRLKAGIGRLLRTHNAGRKYSREARLEIILDLWRETGVDSHKVGRFKQVMERRHWLAHGRYWSDRTIWDPDPEDVVAVARDLFEALSPDFPVS